MFRYSGAGNSFIAIDGRDTDVSRFRERRVIHMLCLANGTDGLMILDKSGTADFKMEFFNPDGSSGMMCGNGGRCIVAFADFLGVKPFHSADYTFEAPDGIHNAQILSQLGDCKMVRLEMRDVQEYKESQGGIFLDTGARHLVLFVPDVEQIDVESEGKRLRSDAEFAPQGTNVDFVSVMSDGSLAVRTYEKGVERETLACGTGITASAIAACLRGFEGRHEGDTYEYPVHARQDDLSVSFVFRDGIFSEVRLTGPALFQGDLFE